MSSKMEKLPMCRICLVQNVRMYLVVNRNFHELYERLTDIPFVTKDRRPILVCFFCCAKLDKCCQLMRKCLEAEEMFAQMTNEDYEPKLLINQDHLEYLGGYIKSPIENISIVDVVQAESITIKEELPAVCEGLDIIEPKEEHQSDAQWEPPEMLSGSQKKTSVPSTPSQWGPCDALDGSWETTSLPMEFVFNHLSSAPEHAVPSPYVTSGGGGDQGTPRRILKSTRRRTLREAEIDLSLNYGSEDDSEDDMGEEDDGMSVFVPRAQRMFFEDEDVDAEGVDASVVQSPKSEAESSTPPLPLRLSPVPTPSSRPLEPTNEFSFEWRAIPNPPVAPTERREVFSEINCGPTAPLLTPYDAFIAIWSRDFMEYIATETNQYAQEFVEKQFQDGSLGPGSRITHWRDTNADELYVFFGLILATGICVKTELSEYWNKDDILITPLFPQFMSHNRFFLLSRCLHFNRNSSDLRRLSRSQAKLHKIAPVVDHLNSQFQSLYRLGRNIAIAETPTQWNGRLEFKQFIKNKFASAGIKTYEVCEARTGYLWRFKVHAGRAKTEQEVTSVSGVIPALVLDLLKGLEYKGRTVWMDNYYNSPALARVLKRLGFDCVGTLSTNRQNVPTQLANLTKSQMAVGQISGCTSGDVDILVWRGQNRVAMISTYHGAAVQCLHGKMKPIAIHDYTVCMGGVDKKDQMLSMYPIERKRTQVWYKKLFQRLLNVSVSNAFILHRSSGKTAITDHREFRKTLIKQLLAKHKDRPGVALRGAIKTWNGSKRQISNVPVFPQEVLQHFLQEYGFIPGRNKERIRRVCVVCRKRVPTFCPTCKVALCIACTSIFHK